jgi:hypothetical protein
LALRSRTLIAAFRKRPALVLAHDAVESVAFDRQPPRLLNESYELGDRERGGRARPRRAVDRLVNDRAVEIVGAEARAICATSGVMLTQ